MEVWADTIVRMEKEGFSKQEILAYINHPLCTSEFYDRVFYRLKRLNRSQGARSFAKRDHVCTLDHIPRENTAARKIYDYIMKHYNKHPILFFKEYKGSWVELQRAIGVPRHRLTRYRYACSIGREPRRRVYMQEYVSFEQRWWVNRILKTGVVTPKRENPEITLKDAKNLW